MFILADNQDITRMGLTLLLSAELSTTPLTAATKQQLTQHLLAHADAVVVLDYTLSDFRTPDELLVFVQRFPQAQWLLFSESLSEAFVRRVSAESNFGIVQKDCAAAEIVTALRCAAAGERYLCHQVTNMLLSASAGRSPEPDSTLTQSEREILKLIALGKTNKEIAALRVSSIHTIVTHRKNIFRKIDVNNVYEATKYALRAGLIDQAEYYI